MKKIMITLAVIAIVGLTPVIISFISLFFSCREPARDHSAQYFVHELYWNDTVYKNTQYIENVFIYESPFKWKDRKGEILAKTTDGKWDIYGLYGEASHTFVVLYDGYDMVLYVRQDYEIPKGGEVTAVYWGDVIIEDPVFCETIQKLYADDSGDTFEYETNDINELTETQHMRPLYLCYDNYPVGTEYTGFTGKVYNKWVITTYIEDNYDPLKGFTQPYKAICRELPSQYFTELEKYFT